jgi:hypothetical protein
MARELSISYQGASANLYCVIRRLSDGYVWSTVSSAFAAWADGSIADYDIALTDDGGDHYYGTFPSAIAAGSYRIFYYERAGASPATTDLVLKSPVRYWSGTALSEDSDVDLSSYALTTLESLKRHMDIDDAESDTLLTELINGTSAEIERVTGIKFKARDYRVWVNGANQRKVVLPHHPVQHVTRVAFGIANAMTLTYAGSGIRANATVYRDPESPDAGGLRITSMSTTGVLTANNLSFATYGSVSALVTAVNLISGWTATTLQNVPTLDLHPGGGEDALNRLVTLTYPDRDDYRYTIDHETGVLAFANGGWWNDGFHGGYEPRGVSGWLRPTEMPRRFQGCLVEFRAGYETIPADVSTLTNRLVADLYQESQIGAGVTELKLGPAQIRLDKSKEDDIRTTLKHLIDESKMIGEAY